MKRPIRFRLNGRPVTLNTEDDRSLLWVLRTDLELELPGVYEDDRFTVYRL